MPDRDVLTENINLRKRVEDLETELASLNDKTPKDTVGLAQGDDKIELEYVFIESNHFGSKQYISLSWNEIMNIILPVVDSSGSESQIEIALSDYILDKLDKYQRLGRVTIPVSTIHLVINQLRALKILIKSATIGNERYYKLTSYGENLFLNSRSIRKDKGN